MEYIMSDQYNPQDPSLPYGEGKPVLPSPFDLMDQTEPLHPNPRIELPVLSRTYVDRVWQVESILQTLENGIYRDASFLIDQTLRDDRIAGVSDTRIMGLLGQPLKMKPANNSDEAAEIALLLEGNEEAPGLFAKMCPPSELIALLKWGIWLGAGVSEIRWDTSTDIWIPILKSWHPNVLWWRWDTTHRDTGSYYLQTTDEGMLEIRPDDGQWILYTPKGYRRSWFEGVIRQLAKPFLARNWTFTSNWPRYNEVHGLPIRLARVPGTASQADQQRFYKAIKNLNSEGTILAPARKSGEPTDGESWGLELIEAKADTYTAFKEFLEFINSAISTRLLGQDAGASDAKGAKAPAAMAASSSETSAMIRRWDALSLSSAIREQVLRPFCQYNYGDGDLAPFPEWQIDPATDTEAKGKYIQSLGTGLNQLSQSGAPIDQRAYLESEGLPVTEIEVDRPVAATNTQSKLVLTPSDIGLIVSVNEGRAAQGLGPLMKNGVIDPEGDLSIAEFKSLHSGIINQGAQAEAGEIKEGNSDVE